MIALTHIPSAKMEAGERTHVPPAPIDPALALVQHTTYCDALRRCGAEVVVVDVNDDCPDGTFIEDTAVVLDEVAVLATLGVPSRRVEAERMEAVLRPYREVVRLEMPATLEGGDVLRIGRRLLVGRSCRTNAAGIEALARIANHFGYTVEAVPVRGCLHLKTACTALPDGRLLLNPAWVTLGGDTVKIAEDEPWAANIALMNGQVLVSAAHPRTNARLRDLGWPVHEIDISEFAKAEGGVTCLSLLVD
jgi:dimethylargininase